MRHAQDHAGVELLMSEAMSDPTVLPVRVVHAEATAFVVYGGMGLGMPGGLINEALAASFPAQFESIQEQMRQENQARGGDLCPTDFVGQVYVSESMSPRPLSKNAGSTPGYGVSVVLTMTAVG